jgi:hypothetical protein
VNHNCAAPQCQATRTRRVLQERQLTDKLEHEVNHAVEPNDRFVNLSQLRSATKVQKFWGGSRFPGLSLVDAIGRSVRNRERLERETKEAEETKETEGQQKAAEWQTKAAEKQAKATQKSVLRKGSAAVKRPRRIREHIRQQRRVRNANGMRLI